MKEYVIPILKGIITGILDAKREKIRFTITCSECGSQREFEDRYVKESGDISVVIAEDLISENIILIQCNKCGNRLFSSDY